jgi:hypothetical protein
MCCLIAMIRLTNQAQLGSSVMTRQVGVETVLLDSASGAYFALNDVGTRVWDLRGQGMSLAEVCYTLVAEYEVGIAEAQDDVLSLVANLEQRGLLEAV